MNNRFEAGGIGFGMVKNGKNTNYLKIKQQKNTYRRNTYRVLLTRGRDGFIVFIPN
ncbi:DNA/RNA helicase domain-containing protein [Methanobrevibacter olleyae]|uniref:DNA/RNA helicase domain-containing protein n=1 Tax=Methanobrevibacter olleyae TaxID=294671 RepID=UPI001180EADE